VSGQFHFDPERYLDMMREEVPLFDRLQDEVATAGGAGARRILDLGVGTGETARRVLAAHPSARLVGIDASEQMLARAREALPADRVDLHVGRLEEPLPDGPFDLVVSCLAVHHLDGDGKADLFRRVREALGPGGRFVLGDVVVPPDPADALTPLTPDFDRPDTVVAQLHWLAEAALAGRVAWSQGDLAVIVASAAG
jgi:tRNA (cmo5U34)-methyltransferase